MLSLVHSDDKGRPFCPCEQISSRAEEIMASIVSHWEGNGSVWTTGKFGADLLLFILLYIG